MTRIAAIDCGTNSIRLLIAEYEDGVITDLLRTMTIVRLGQGVDDTGSLDPAAIERTRVALTKYVALMLTHNVEYVRMVATSATRDASNKQEFFDMTKKLLAAIQPGAQAEVISGQEEARLSFRGAVAQLDPGAGPFAVIDLGGGSTEFIVGTAAGEILGAHSAQMGCVRLTERILHTDPPTTDEIATARTYVQDQLAQVTAEVPLSEAKTFVGCAGTFTTMAALDLGLTEYDPVKIDGTHVSFSHLQAITDRMIAKSSEQRRANPVIHPGRADVLAGGSIVIQEIIKLVGSEGSASEIIVSERDILDGIIAGLADSISAK